MTDVGGVARINGNLNLSRAIGDLKYKLNEDLPREAQARAAAVAAQRGPSVPLRLRGRPLCGSVRASHAALTPIDSARLRAYVQGYVAMCCCAGFWRPRDSALACGRSVAA